MNLYCNGEYVGRRLYYNNYLYKDCFSYLEDSKDKIIEVKHLPGKQIFMTYRETELYNDKKLFVLQVSDKGVYKFLNYEEGKNIADLCNSIMWSNEFLEYLGIYGFSNIDFKDNNFYISGFSIYPSKILEQKINSSRYRSSLEICSFMKHYAIKFNLSSKILQKQLEYIPPLRYKFVEKSICFDYDTGCFETSKTEANIPHYLTAIAFEEDERIGIFNSGGKARFGDNDYKIINSLQNIIYNNDLIQWIKKGEPEFKTLVLPQELKHEEQFTVSFAEIPYEKESVIDVLNDLLLKELSYATASNIGINLTKRTLHISFSVNRSD